MSAHGKAAKDALDLAITNYRYNAAMVKRTLKSSSPNERTLSHKFQALLEALTSLNIAHTSWIFKASIDNESPYTSQRLKSCWNEVDDLKHRSPSSFTS